MFHFQGPASALAGENGEERPARSRRKYPRQGFQVASRTSTHRSSAVEALKGNIVLDPEGPNSKAVAPVRHNLRAIRLRGTARDGKHFFAESQLAHSKT
jgi:hypothetical protein